jgi:hypothetical protein
MSEFKGTMDEIVQNGANGVHTKKGICVALTHGANCKVNALMIADAFKVRQQINCELSDLLEMNKKLKEMYKECFELFIPTNKWDEATEFLSTYGNGIAKSLSQKQK